MDYDATQAAILTELEWQGEERKGHSLGQSQRSILCLDRETGEFLLGEPFVSVNWLSGFDENGRPIRALYPTEEGTFIMPNNQGATSKLVSALIFSGYRIVLHAGLA